MTRAPPRAPIPREPAERLREAKRRMDKQLWIEAHANDAYAVAAPPRQRKPVTQRPRRMRANSRAREADAAL